MMRAFLWVVGAIVVALAAAFFYLSDPSIPRATLEAKYATPPSQFLTLADGTRVHYRDQGPRNGPVLVLLHGSNASLFTWEPWASRLGDTYRVITMDLPSHGLTGAVPSGDYSEKGMSDFVERVADKLGLVRFAIGGNSMGGGVAARFTEDYPLRVTALILVDAGGMPVKRGDDVPLGFHIARTPVIKNLMLYITPRSLFENGLEKSFEHKNLITPAMVDQYWELNRMEGSRAATMVRFQLPFDMHVSAHAGDIKAPTLILWGQMDHLIPVDAAYAWRKAIPGSKLIVYPDAGHILQEDEADKSAADVRTFLGGLPH